MEMEIVFHMLLLFLFMNFAWSNPHSQTIQYTREFLLNLQWSQTLNPALQARISNICPELHSVTQNNPEIAGNNFKKVVKKRGKRGGVRQRLRRQFQNNRILLPSIILANVQSLRNKTDELQGNVTYLLEYRDACLLAFTETWLFDSDSDASWDLKGFGFPVRR